LPLKFQLAHLQNGKPGAVHTCHPNTCEAEAGRWRIHSQLGQLSKTLSQKPQNKKKGNELNHIVMRMK
jgi:hypothetical protein